MNRRRPVPPVEAPRLIKAEEVKKYLGDKTQKPKSLITIQENLNHRLPPPYCEGTLYSDLPPLAWVADRLRPDALARLAALWRAHPADNAVVILSGWLRARFRGSRGTYEVIFQPPDEAKPRYYAIADISQDFGQLCACMAWFFPYWERLREGWPLDRLDAGRVCDAAFAFAPLWTMSDSERALFNAFIEFRRHCDPNNRLQGISRDYLPSLAEEEEDRARGEAERDAVIVDGQRVTFGKPYKPKGGGSEGIDSGGGGGRLSYEDMASFRINNRLDKLDAGSGFVKESKSGAKGIDRRTIPDTEAGNEAEAEREAAREQLELDELLDKKQKRKRRSRANETQAERTARLRAELRELEKERNKETDDD